MPPTPGRTADDRTLVLAPEWPSATLTGTLTAPERGKHRYTLYRIDARAFRNGGELQLEVAVGNGATDASFDLFPAAATLPIEGDPSASLARAYDVRRGSSTTLRHRFTTGQVFVLGAEGTGASPPDSTNTFTLTARVRTP